MPKRKEVVPTNDAKLSNDEDLFIDKKELTDDENAMDSSEESEDGEGDDSTDESGLEEDDLDNKADEYQFDSSDEEDIRNTVGNIPMQWYEDLAHLGYDVSGKKIIKPIKQDELEKFLEKMDNPDYWRTVFDEKTEENIVLNEEQLDIIDKIQNNRFPGAVDPYEDYIDFFTHEKMIHPVTRQPEHKRSFIPSLIEKEKVSRLVHAIKMGWLKQKKKTPEDKNQFYDIWENETVEVNKRTKAHIAAPQEKLPSHNESYNPPPEYLPTEEEALAWKEAHPDDRQTDFLPQKYDCLRKVPGYENFMKERFERCLDLYLCPRQRRMRVQVDAEDLLPKLTKPRDLQPFPTTQALIYLGHDSYVRTISVDPSGQWLASGSDDQTVRLWEVSTGRCMQVIKMSGVVESIAWCPNQSINLILVAVGSEVHLINPNLGDKLVTSSTDKLLDSYVKPEEHKTSHLVEWTAAEDEAHIKGFRLTLKVFKAVKRVSWHGKGDYFTTVIPEGGHSSVLIHQLSKRRSQNPFSKSKGLIQAVVFHPSRPFLFVASQRYVRVYNLLKQEQTKKLLTNAKWVSSMSIHPQGDNIIIGSYDCKLSWFDLDLSTKPYHTLRHHKRAVRQVNFHKRYPLFASASDDGTVIVCHGMVYNDLLQNPLIVPVKILRGHEVTNSLGVLDCQFHPNQPWVFSAGADGTIRLFT
ncbi:ribosome biogenesis protein bop1-A-like [Anneissia japonica]|uniref:ribosome biogenesis protein bop1-A-like n=1 Tax=Anneissia japonica TaxID=1529436 RepID=UPI0014255A66|nr:ribosome biogenesis protein bop1-A-like [Anneissia japonica]